MRSDPSSLHNRSGKASKRAGVREQQQQQHARSEIITRSSGDDADTKARPQSWSHTWSKSFKMARTELPMHSGANDPSWRSYTEQWYLCAALLLVQRICQKLQRFLQRLLRRASLLLKSDLLYCRFVLALALPLPFVISYRSLDYALGSNDASWTEFAAVYDLDKNHRYNMSELSAIFNFDTHHGPWGGRLCRKNATCLPHDRASKWVQQVDVEKDGVDQDELLDMFEQMPRPFMTPHIVERMERLSRNSWRLKFMHKVFVASSIVATVFCIKWLLHEMKLRKDLQVLKWRRGVDARRRQVNDKKAAEAEREVELTRGRLLRVQRELGRLSDEKQKKEEEHRRLQAELLDKETFLRARTDPLEVQSERHVYFLYASPLLQIKTGVPLVVDKLKIDEEYKSIKDALRSGNLDIGVNLATPEHLLDAILSDAHGSCLHVSCHGGRFGDESFLLLENKVGLASGLTTTKARQFLTQKPIRSPPEVVVLLCCESEMFGRMLTDVGVHYVVCTRGQLPDRMALEFSRAFWNGMTNLETSVEEAFYRALVYVRAEGFERAANLLVLLPDEQHQLVKHELRRDTSRNSNRSSRHRTFEHQHLSVSLEDFVGRDLFLHQLLADCLSGRDPRRLLCLHAASGIGKSAFLTYLARFVHTPGRLFSQGVIYDHTWSKRDEPWWWLWLEATWNLLGSQTPDASGLQPDSSFREILLRLCEELTQATTKRLLIIDDADRWKERSVLEAALVELLAETNVTVIMTAQKPWRKDIHGYKVVDIELKKLDSASAAKLFLKRVRRPLHHGDFEMSGGEGQANYSSARATTEERESHAVAFQQHPLHHALDGNPAKIRMAAERVTEDLKSLHDLHDLLFDSLA